MVHTAAEGSRAGLPPAVVCPLDEHMGLDIARSLASHGVRVFGIDTDAHVPGRHSNALTFVHCPHSEETDERAYLDFLLEFGGGLETKAVLYPLSDRHVLLFSEHRAALSERFHIVMPPNDTMVKLTTKDGLDDIARVHDIPAPQTHFLAKPEDIHEVAAQVPYPAILKPTESTYWHSAEITSLLRTGLTQGRAKVILCHDAEELVSAFEQIAVFDPRMIVQEVIPGEDERLVYAAFYLDRESAPLGYFSGRKHRVIPTGFGSASFVETFDDPALRDAVFKVLSSVGYQGHGGLEFKQDPRDGVYKLIEFNTRFGMWDGLGVRCGVDLPYLSYCDAVGVPVEPQLQFAEGATWLDWQRDLRAFLEYRRQGTWTLGAWLRSIRRPTMIAIYSLADWRPGVAFTFGLFRKLAGRLAAPFGGGALQPSERP